MEKELQKIYNTLLQIETHGASTVLMASVLEAFINILNNTQERSDK